MSQNYWQAEGILLEYEKTVLEYLKWHLLINLVFNFTFDLKVLCFTKTYNCAYYYFSKIQYTFECIPNIQYTFNYIAPETYWNW